MSKILLATTSFHKIIEFKNLNNLFGNKFTLISLNELEKDIDEAPETSKTFQGNALQKANYYWNKYHIPVLCDDSGLEVFELKLFPGVNSKRWLENKGFNFKIKKLLAMIGNKDCACQYVCALAYRDQNHEQVFIGKFKGKLVKPTTKKSFGFDSGFYVNQYQTIFSNISLENKNKISHRYQAFKKFVDWFNENS